MSKKTNDEKAMATLDKISAKDVETLKLYKPLNVDGKILTELNFNFAGLDGGEVVMQVEAQMIAMGLPNGTGLSEFSKTYLLCVASHACGVNINYLKKASLKDITSITMLTQSFLLVGRD